VLQVKWPEVEYNYYIMLLHLYDLFMKS